MGPEDTFLHDQLDADRIRTSSDKVPILIPVLLRDVDNTGR